MPEISVIVPVYNAQQYLSACVESILGQTFSDLELLLVDDGSPDRCGALCEEYAARDSRVRVIHQENQGQAAARNRALAQAAGDWVCFVDSDDLIHPQTLELLRSALRESGAPISMCRMLEAPQLPEDFARPRSGAFERVPMDEQTLLDLFDRGDYPGWVACGKLLPKKLVEQHLFCPGRVYEDNEAVCHWICAAGALALIDQPLYFYRSNPASTTQRSFGLKRLDYLWALEGIIRFYTGRGYERLAGRFCGLYAEAAAGCYIRVLHELKLPRQAKKIKRSVRALYRTPGVRLRKEQFEILFDAMHPRLIRLYWPLEGAVRTLRRAGPGGLVRKIAEQLGKGAGT